MATGTQKPLDVVVLNTILATAGDLSLAGGKMDVTNLGEAIKIADGVSSTKTAYAAGTPSIKSYNMTGATIADNAIYRLTVSVAKANTVSGTGSAEADQINAVREYTVSTEAGATATKLKLLFEARINADPQATVTAAGSTTNLELTLKKIDGGDFTVVAPSGVGESVGTAFVAPAGTPAIVEACAPSQSSPTATYTTWTIVYNRNSRHYAVGGAYVQNTVYVDIFADSGATNYAAFVTEIDKILAGTHTPASDYLGI
jgi:hypothetical protein